MTQGAHRFDDVDSELTSVSSREIWLRGLHGGALPIVFIREKFGL